MKKGISKAYYIIPILYVILIGVLVYLHFESGIKFEEKLKGYTIFGEYERLERGKIKSIELKFGNFSLVFSNTHPLKAKLKESGREKDIALYPINYSVIGDNESSFTFTNREKLKENRIKVTLEVIETERGTLYVKPLPPKNFLISEILLSFKTTSNVLRSTGAFPIVFFNGKGITLPYGSSVYYNPNEISLKIGSQDDSIHILTKRITEKKNLPLIYLQDRLKLDEKPANLRTTKRWEKDIIAYLDKAFTGWNDKRFDRRRNKWRVGEGYIFDERIEAAVVSELLAREEEKLIRNYLTALRMAMREKPNSPLPYLTSPYFGGLKKFIKITHSRAKTFSNFIREEINELKLNFLKEPDLVIYLLDNAPYSLLEETTKYGDSLEIEKINTKTAVYLLNYYTELIRYVGYKDIHLDRINSLIDKKILPAVTLLGGRNIMIRTRPKSKPNPYLSLMAGIDISLIKGLSPAKQEIGKLLVISTLRLADSTGKIETLYPEELYPLLCRIIPRYYPKEIPLFRISKPGEWLWTAAVVKEIDFTNRVLKIQIQYPTNQPHFMLIQGVEKPREVILHNTTWHPDSFYYNYRDGWFYEEKTQSLFIKYTNRKKIETLKIIF